MREIVIYLLGVIFLSSRSSFTQSAPIVRESRNRNEAVLTKRVPPANVSAYRSIRDTTEWRNPFLMVGADGISIRWGKSAAKPVTKPPAQVIAYLEKLPPQAWPYGLVVAEAENGVRDVGEDARIKNNREQIVRLLRREGVKVELWPSA
jgi:hypothetical protein